MLYAQTVVRLCQDGSPQLEMAAKSDQLLWMVPGKSLQWETKKITWAPSQSVHLDAAIRPAGLASVAAASVGAVPHLVASGGVEAQAGSGDSQYQMVALQPVAIGGRMKGTCRIARVQLPGGMVTVRTTVRLEDGRKGATVATTAISMVSSLVLSAKAQIGGVETVLRRVITAVGMGARSITRADL
mmetsp:Transcript_9044/g.27098  ORF Transcript_9044/g.27098 Transcript_9044/m.27098 type:complete len:186 (+) Transcript_9044:195-752(+)